MSALSNHAEALLLQWFMTDETVTRPTAWFVALYSAAPSDAGGGTELSGYGYARQSVDFGSDGAANTADVTFTASGGDWANATHIGLFDASTSGNLLWHGALTAAKQIDDGDSIVFGPGDIDLSLD